MISWRVSKYNPIYRNTKDEYENDEWTSCYEIGKIYQGKMFTVNDYMDIENTYIIALISFMKSVNVPALFVKSLEKHGDFLFDETPLIYTKSMIELYNRVHEGILLEIKYIEELCRLILREKLWCKLENDKNFFIHFGYDYYMYICSMSYSEEIINMIEGIGLFVEPLKSPYI